MFPVLFAITFAVIGVGSLIKGEVSLGLLSLVAAVFCVIVVMRRLRAMAQYLAEPDESSPTAPH